MALFQQGSFVYDPKADTPESVARKRALVARIMGTGPVVTPRNNWDGLGNAFSSIAGGIAARSLDQQADAAAQAGQESAASAWNPLLASMGVQQFPSTPGGGDTASASSDVPSQRVAQAFGDSATPQGGGGDVEAYVRQAATARGIDPDIAVRVVKGEGGFKDPFQRGRGPAPRSQAAGFGATENSFGPLQLYISGTGAGLGDRAVAAGIDPRKNWKGGVDFALDEVAKKGWGQWYGAKAAGITGMMGVGRRPAAVQAADAMTTGQPAPPAPVQVASLDPSAGLPDIAPVPSPSPGPANVPVASGKGDRVANLTTRSVPLQPGPMAAGDSQSAFVDRMTSPQSMTGGAPMPMQGMPASATQPVQVAQANSAGPDLSRIPVAAGGASGAYQPDQGPSLQLLMQAASNPWLNENQRGIINMMLKQRLDPNAALDTEYKRAQIDYYKRRGGSLINAGNGNIYDPQTGQWISAPAPEGDAPLFDGKSVQAQGLNYLVRTGELTKDQAAQLAAGKTITDPSTGAITFMTPQGLVTQPGNGGGQSDGNGQIPLTGPKKPTDTEYATGIYADRMTNAGKIIEGLEGEGTSLKDSFLNGLPLGNYMVSGDYQKFDQAQRDFINAVLRRESGAVISDEEFANARKQYLPQPGDTPEVLKQKRLNRQIAIDGMRRAAGPGYNAGQPSAPSASPKRLKFNPATGELE